MLASSHDAQSQALAATFVGAPVAGVRPACDAFVHTTNSFQNPLLEEQSFSQINADLVVDPCLSQKSTTSAAAAWEAVTLPKGTVHSHACPSRLCLHSDSSSTSSGSSQDSSSASQHSSRLLQLADLHEESPKVSGQLTAPLEAFPRASGLLQDGDFSMQMGQAAPSLCAESLEESRLTSLTPSLAEASGCSHHTLNTAQKMSESTLQPPTGSAIADVRQSMDVHQSTAGLQALIAVSEAHKRKCNSQQANVQRQSTNPVSPSENSVAAAVDGDATPKQVM